MPALSDEAIDTRLHALLAEPELTPDPGFTGRVMAMIDVEERLAATRRRAWRRFAGEALAAGAVALALLVLARMGVGGTDSSAGPGLAGLLAVLAWLGTGQTPRAAA